jgi:hypothetical protein
MKTQKNTFSWKHKIGGRAIVLAPSYDAMCEKDFLTKHENAHPSINSLHSIKDDVIFKIFYKENIVPGEEKSLSEFYKTLDTNISKSYIFKYFFNLTYSLIKRIPRLCPGIVLPEKVDELNVRDGYYSLAPLCLNKAIQVFKQKNSVLLRKGVSAVA